MKIRIEATEEEFQSRQWELVKALNEAFPGFSDLVKAEIPNKTSRLKYAVLRHLNEETLVMYRKQLEMMTREIGEVIDRAVKDNPTYNKGSGKRT